jgi:hypothetical protein
MEYPLDISVTAPFDIGDHVAQIEFQDGSSSRVTLRGGHFCKSQALRPVRMKLTLETPDPGEDQASTARSAPAGETVDVEQLYVRCEDSDGWQTDHPSVVGMPLP